MLVDSALGQAHSCLERDSIEKGKGMILAKLTKRLKDATRDVFIGSHHVLPMRKPPHTPPTEKHKKERERKKRESRRTLQR
jgi:hypothetical protein